MAFAPFLHGMPGPIVRPPTIQGPQLNNIGNRTLGQPPGFGGVQGAPPPSYRPMPTTSQPFGGGGNIQPPMPSPGFGSQPPVGYGGPQGPGFAQQQPIASFDNLKHVHTITKSGLYRLKKGEKVVPLSSLAHV